MGYIWVITCVFLKGYPEIPGIPVIFRAHFCFNNHKQEDLWGGDEWRFFISDLQSNYLKKDGLIVLNFNEEEPGVYFSEELITFFNNKNYQIDGNTILISSSLTV